MTSSIVLTFYKTFYHPHNPAGIYLLKVNDRNTRTRCEIFSKLTIKTYEQISHLDLVFLLLTFNM